MIINKEKNFVSAVIYIHNNEKEIGNFLKKISNTLSENFEKYEIICVDDKSTDSSVEQIKKVSNDIVDSTISIINMSYYQGLELSMNAGIDLAIGDFVYEFDNVYIDYDLELLMKIYNVALEGYDIVSATSNAKKRFTSKIFYTIFNRTSNNVYKINTETFRILSRRAINRVKSININIPYRKAVYASSGLKLCTIKYKVVKNIEQKIPKEIIDTKKELAVDSIVLFTDVAYKFAITMAMIMMAAVILTVIYTIYIFLCKKPIAGWTTTMLLISFAFLGVFSILTIMIKYLSILVNLIFKKQKYIIESIEKIK